jgi:hypothetical protein
MKLHQINCLFAKNVMILNKIVDIQTSVGIYFIPVSSISSPRLRLDKLSWLFPGMKHFPPRYVIYYNSCLTDPEGVRKSLEKDLGTLFLLYNFYI